LLGRRRTVVRGTNVAHVPSVSWHELTSDNVCESEATFVQDIAFENGSKARVEGDRTSVNECESEANGEGNLLSKVEDRGRDSRPECYREVGSRVHGHGNIYVVYVKLSLGLFSVQLYPGRLL
jgi:hypothetical protein